MKIVLIGDSITESFDHEKLIPEFSVVNKGVYGDNSSHLLKRIYQDVIQENPTVVCILIGTNDMAAGHSDSLIHANFEKIISRIVKGLPKTRLFIQSILPTRGLQNRPMGRIFKLNAKIHLLASEFGCTFLDIGSLFVNSEGELDEQFSEDGLHLTPLAYQYWAEYLRKIFSTIEKYETDVNKTNGQ